MKTTITSYIKIIALAMIAAVIFSACRKDHGYIYTPVPVATLGVYVLSEGKYGDANNSTITYYNTTTGATDKNFYKTQNGTDLGNNANDLKQYGRKMYCVVTGTTFAAKDSYLEVMNTATGKSIKRIALSNSDAGFLPRYIVFDKSKAYISAYDGSITKIDTANLVIESRIQAGGALEQMAIANNKLYVVNSAHFQFGTANNSAVTVIDLNTFTKSKEIAVGYNPTKISANSSGDLLVLSKGDYFSIQPSVDRISSITDTKTNSVANLTYEYINVTGTKGFAIGDYTDPFLKLINTSTGALGSNFITDGTVIASPYGITTNPLDFTVFVADANNYAAEGKIFCFSPEGKKNYQFTTGANPQSAVFNYKYF
ncbi:hypothetical protein LPB86_12440 [Pedobacter sp. MC2016-14]|uniref:YncE family protein n=1 Tax=Pedobacter sp. MC2016-14 TaxID=2897327 RepID=UPI001E574E66|nr:DUF5074 domain-containing protein [Pedobacter sp. MC2016-14]MCD0489040.1 hypothetical protein [Pedobacter sp. MC2016-14]